MKWILWMPSWLQRCVGERAPMLTGWLGAGVGSTRMEHSCWLAEWLHIWRESAVQECWLLGAQLDEAVERVGGSWQARRQCCVATPAGTHPLASPPWSVGSASTMSSSSPATPACFAPTLLL